MLEKVKEYFEREYISTVRAIERKYSWGTPREFVNMGITNCLAVAMFSQSIGVKFEDLDPLYNEYKEKLEALLK